jgi:dATP pyrophosphohydrolase
MKPQAVAVYVFRRTPVIELLQLRRAGPRDPYRATWHNVYGGVEEGETAPEAALRELAEETALRPIRFFQVEHLEMFYFRATDQITTMPVFAVEVDPEATPVLDPEHDGWRWVAADDFARWFMWRSQREAIAVLLDQLERGNEAHARLHFEV